MAFCAPNGSPALHDNQACSLAHKDPGKETPACYWDSHSAVVFVPATTSRSRTNMAHDTGGVAFLPPFSSPLLVERSPLHTKQEHRRLSDQQLCTLEVLNTAEGGTGGLQGPPAVRKYTSRRGNEKKRPAICRHYSCIKCNVWVKQLCRIYFSVIYLLCLVSACVRRGWQPSKVICLICSVSIFITGAGRRSPPFLSGELAQKIIIN